MNNNLKNEIFDKLLALAPTILTAENAHTIEEIMKLIDKLVESEAIKARLEIIKNLSKRSDIQRRKPWIHASTKSTMSTALTAH